MRCGWARLALRGLQLAARRPAVDCPGDALVRALPLGQVYLNLVLEYIPETVYRVTRQYAKERNIW